MVPIGTTALSVLTAQAPEFVSRSYAPGRALIEQQNHAATATTQVRIEASDVGFDERIGCADDNRVERRQRSRVAQSVRRTTGVCAEIARRHDSARQNEPWIALDGASNKRRHPRRARIKEQNRESRLSDVDDDVRRRRVFAARNHCVNAKRSGAGAVGTNVSDSDVRSSSDATPRHAIYHEAVRAQRHVERSAARTGVRAEIGDRHASIWWRGGGCAYGIERQRWPVRRH